MSAAAPADAALAAFACEVGTDGPVAVEGARTRWSVGGDLNAGTRLLRAPTGTVEHRPEEMTVRVRAGAAVAELHAELASAGQRTALPERGGTVGGAIAVGENHVEALGRGALRNSVLQVRYVSAAGAVVSGGGPTVKNVTGFNLPKLLVGSLGSLGLLAEVTLRTNPTPPMSTWLMATDADPFAVPDVTLRPGAVLWDGHSTWVLLEGHPPDVAAERQRLATVGRFEEAESPPALPPHRWSLPPGGLRELASASHGRFVASIGVGTVYATTPQAQRPLPPPARVVSERMKRLFDPTGRLNPGRDPAAR